MKTAKVLAGLLSLTAVLQACMGDAPKTPSDSKLEEEAAAFTADAALLVHKNKCTGNSMVLASVTGAHFIWSANKGLSTDSSLDIPVKGTTDLAGCIYSKGNTLEGGSAKIDFRAQTTNSFNFVRDSRIIQYIFGYDLKDNPEGSVANTEATGVMQFATQSITRVGGANLTLPAGIGDAIALKVNGILQVAGFKVPVEIPVAMTKTDKGFNVTNSGVWTLNIRGGTQSTNTMGLDARVNEILALVVNGTLQDLIDVHFDIDFVDLCAQ